MSTANSSSVGQDKTMFAPDEADGLANFALIECLKSAGQAIGKAQWEISRRLPVDEDEVTLAHLRVAAEQVAQALEALL